MMVTVALESVKAGSLDDIVTVKRSSFSSALSLSTMILLQSKSPNTEPLLKVRRDDSSGE